MIEKIYIKLQSFLLTYDFNILYVSQVMRIPGFENCGYAKIKQVFQAKFQALNALVICNHGPLTPGE